MLKEPLIWNLNFKIANSSFEINFNFNILHQDSWLMSLPEKIENGAKERMKLNESWSWAKNQAKQRIRAEQRMKLNKSWILNQLKEHPKHGIIILIFAYS